MVCAFGVRLQVHVSLEDLPSHFTEDALARLIRRRSSRRGEVGF